MSGGLDRGLELLELLAQHKELRAADLVDRLGVSRATAFRTLVTLERKGYVEQVGERRGWRLGSAVAELAAAVDSDDLARHCAPALADLHRQTGETINLAVFSRRRVNYAATVASRFPLHMTTVVGEEVPLHCTAIGKAILAALPDDEWPRLLPVDPYPALTPNSKLTLKTLSPDIADARKVGWALDNEECEISGVCVAAAILSPAGRPVGAISVSSVAGRFPEPHREIVGASVAAWCDRISDQLEAARS